MNRQTFSLALAAVLVAVNALAQTPPPTTQAPPPAAPAAQPQQRGDEGGSDDVKEKFFSNMSERARGMFKDDMEAKGPMRLSDVEEAQKIIMRTARKLADAGDLVLGGGADYV